MGSHFRSHSGASGPEPRLDCLVVFELLSECVPGRFARIGDCWFARWQIKLVRQVLLPQFRNPLL